MLTKVEDAVAVFDLQVRDKTVVTCISPEEKQNPKTLAINTSSKLHVWLDVQLEDMQKWTKQ